jgi:hypothetical protein
MPITTIQAPLTPNHSRLLHLPCSIAWKEEENQYLLGLNHMKSEMGTMGNKDFQGDGGHKNLGDQMDMTS